MATTATSCLKATHDDLIQPMRGLGIHEDVNVNWDELITSEHLGLVEGEFQCRPRYKGMVMTITKKQYGTLLECLTLAEYVQAGRSLNEEQRYEFLSMRAPAMELAPRWRVTPDNYFPELVFYGIPVDVHDLCDIAKEYHERKQTHYVVSHRERRRAINLINAACHVTHIRAHRVLVTPDSKRTWVIALYNNRDMADWGFPNQEEEDRLITIIQKLLHLPERPPTMWLWAVREEYPTEHGIEVY